MEDPMSHNRWMAAACIITAIAAFCLASISAQAKSNTVKTEPGEAKQIGNGMATSWVELKEDGKPVSIGVTFDKGMLTGLPGEDTEYVLALPHASLTGFYLMGIDWNPNGHIPPGIYDVPHFDFHFYLVDQGVRDGITATGSNLELIRKKPMDAYIPQGYVFAPESERPLEGVHWVDMSRPEFHGKPFTATFIYGFYNGTMSFLEPMVTTKYLQTRPSLTEKVNLPTAFAQPGYYPTRYSVTYDKLTGKYTVAIERLKIRQMTSGRP
jgi:hypothetical protein